MDVYSRLFEEISTLTRHLDLHCSHIFTAASNLNWIQVFHVVKSAGTELKSYF